MILSLISVLLPVRNGGELLIESVNSILGQSYVHFELIIIDDGSTDGAIDNIANMDERLTIVSNRGQGIVDALNTGFDISQGDFIARMDADDISLTHRFQSQINYLNRHANVGICATQVEIFSDDGNIAGGYREYERWINQLCDPKDIVREIFVESPLPHPTVMMRRWVFETLGGYHDSVWAEDYDMWLRAFENNIAMGKPEGVCLRWRDRMDRTSRVEKRYHKQQFLSAKAHYLARTLLVNRDVVLLGAGPNGINFLKALRCYDVKVKAFIDIDPKKIGQYKQGLPVLALSALDQYPNALFLGTVASRGARQRIRDLLNIQGLSEGDNYVFAN